MSEIWKDICGYVGLYQVSNLGRVKNKNGALMKTNPSRDGYVRIQLRKNGEYKSKYVHRLVALAFLENPYGLPEVNHIDGDKTNNRADNLEWVTRTENHVHAVKLGLKPICPTIGKYGAENPCVTPVLQYDLNGNFVKEWKCRADAAKHYNGSANSISRCMNGVRKTYKGFIWRHGTK